MKNTKTNKAESVKLSDIKKNGTKLTAKDTIQAKKKILDDAINEEVGKIESSFSLQSLSMKDLKWGAKLNVRTILPRSYHRYKITLELDEQPWLDRIDDYESELNESLFRDEKTTRKEVEKRIQMQRDQLKQTKEQCEKIDFSAIVDALRYRDNDTVIELRLPDDVIEPINRQKVRMPLYKISLIPLF
jgi:hypothetical protein